MARPRLADDALETLPVLIGSRRAERRHYSDPRCQAAAGAGEHFPGKRVSETD